jgi:cysteine sulfinate desulfinase/cysteine desulfurase-like protein
MGVDPVSAINFIRVSFTLDNDIDQVEALIQALIQVKV